MKRTPLRRISEKRLAKLGYTPRSTIFPVKPIQVQIERTPDSMVMKISPVEREITYARPELVPVPKSPDRVRCSAVQRIDDPSHPRGYREICNDAELRRRKLEKYEEQSHLCALCQIFIEPEDLEVDHIVPKGMGGSKRDDHRDNLRAAHSWCNSDKGSQTDEALAVKRSAELDRDRLRTAIGHLRSTSCSCGRGKTPGSSFCTDEMVELSAQMQRDLYDTTGLTWVEAYESAEIYLRNRRVS